MNPWYQCVSYYACVLSQIGYTALMEAAENGRTEVVVELIKAGVNLNLLNKVILCMSTGVDPRGDPRGPCPPP